MRRRTIPSDRYNVDEAVRRGIRAKAIMDDEIYREAVDRASDRFHDDWLASSELTDREAAWAKTHGLEAIQDQLREIIADGEIAASRVEE